MIRSLVAVCYLLATGCSTPQNSTKPSDSVDTNGQDAFQGEWKMISYTSGLKADTPEQLAKYTVSVVGETFTIGYAGNDEIFKIDINKSTSPHTIDFILSGPVRSGGIMEGIYKFENERLVLCFAQHYQERPKEFLPNKTNKIMVLERVKK